MDNPAQTAANMMGGSIPGIGPNPMGQFYAAQLMGQNNVQAPLEQDAQITANATAAERLKQLQSQTDAIKAKADLDTQDATQAKDVGALYGTEEKSAKMQTNIKDSYTKMTQDDQQVADIHLNADHVAAQVALHFGNGKEEDTKAFLMNNKAAQDQINAIRVKVGSPPLDLSTEEGVNTLFAKGHAAENTAKFRQEQRLQGTKIEGELAGDRIKANATVEAATIAAGAVKTSEGVAAQLLKEAQKVGYEGLSDVKLGQLVGDIHRETMKNIATNETATMEQFAVNAEKDPEKRSKMQDKFDTKWYGKDYMDAMEEVRRRGPKASRAAVQGAAAATRTPPPPPSSNPQPDNYGGEARGAMTSGAASGGPVQNTPTVQGTKAGPGRKVNGQDIPPNAVWTIKGDQAGWAW